MWVYNILFFLQYEPKSRPTFPEIVQTLDGIIPSLEAELENGKLCKRQSVDQELMSSMSDLIHCRSRGFRRSSSKLRSHSADARDCMGHQCPPSEKARCHSARRVAELASRKDPHYRPTRANPFHAFGGVKKILGDLFSSCLELPSLEEDLKSPEANSKLMLERKKPCSSEPSSPTARNKWEKKVSTLRHYPKHLRPRHPFKCCVTY